ncbi:MAG: M20/M25/M40 family metallo-hydrolase [Phycisphaerae bacterium]
MPARLILVPLIVALTQIRGGTPPPQTTDADQTGPSVADAYGEVARKIIDATLAGNDAYAKLERLCDDIGHRVSGSESLEQAVAWAVATMKADGQENVHAEKVMVPRWVRGKEWARMVRPRRLELHMTGLGMSVGTPPEGLTAPVVCVADEAEFEAAADRIKGRIVLFNNPMPEYDPEKGAGYGETVRFRGKGPSMVARKGGVACLVRSVTARSLRSPHTGATHYDDGVTKSPAAAISTEDAGIIQRLTDRGKEVVVTLKMDARNEGLVPSANVIGELRGASRPEEVVVIGGHLDSWDVGQGAHDDGGGCVMAMEAIRVLRRLGLRPRRTIRVVLWTNEENGLNGGRQYAEDHANELARHVAGIEADSGAFAPRGFSVQCAGAERQAVAAERLKRILRLLEPIGATSVSTGWSGADVSQIKKGGAALLGLRVDGRRYFDYHHSHADTLDKVSPDDLSKCVAAMAVVSYVLADMPGRLTDAPAAAD